jgi:hypothetical protein
VALRGYLQENSLYFEYLEMGNPMRVRAWLDFNGDHLTGTFWLLPHNYQYPTPIPVEGNAAANP